MRNAFVEELLSLARKDDRVTLLSGDIGNHMFDAFKAEYPDRFYNCGIAEANMTGVAAGMALSGLRPVTYTIAAFNTARCLEQIRVDICYHGLPVVIVGTGGGLSYANLGPTHHALEDVAWMRSLPGMTVVCAGDPVETRLALRAALAHDGPVYLRIGKKGEPCVHQTPPEFTLGRCLPLRQGRDVCLLGVGAILPEAVKAAQLLGQQGISAGVASMPTVKPLDTAFLANLGDTVRLVAVVEEHGPCGGAFEAVAAFFAVRGGNLPRLVRFGTPDAFLCEAGGQGWHREKLGLDGAAMARRVAEAFKERP